MTNFYKDNILCCSSADLTKIKVATTEDPKIPQPKWPTNCLRN